MCQLCEKEPIYEFTNKRKLCWRCFINWFQKKALYTIRKYEMIKNYDIVGYELKLKSKKEKDKKEIRKYSREIVLEKILEMYSEKNPIEIVNLSNKTGKNKEEKITKKAIPSTIDTESYKIVHEIISGKASNLKEVSPFVKYKNKNYSLIRPLYLFLDEEVLLYLRLKLGYNVDKNNLEEKNSGKDKISSFLEDLEEKHPEVKRSTVKSYLNLYGER